MTDLESRPPAPLPPDDLRRSLADTRADSPVARHIGLVGDTYTILLSGQDTNGAYTLIDMYVPSGGGPGPHRHDFEESFTVLEGEIEAVFRGEKTVVRAGETINVPANAPHMFTNRSSVPVRLLCICAPAGIDEFFSQIGVPLSSRTETPPPLNEEEKRAFMQKAKELGPKYRTQPLDHP